MKPKIKRKEYQLLFEKNHKVYSKNYVFYYRPFKKMVVKTAVKKKVGKAVIRNYYKRRLREILKSIVSKNPQEKLLILAIVIRKHNLTFNEEYQSIERSIQPIFS